MKLEVGKTYIFKNEDRKNIYMGLNPFNKSRVENYYRNGFKIKDVSENGRNGGLKDTFSWLIIENEIHLFKEKEEEEKPVIVGKTYTFKDEPVNLDSLLATRYKILHDIKVLEEMILGQRGLLNNVNNQLIKFFENEYNTLQKSLVTLG